ncbi:hypothetical protein FNW02_22830 [Komarekiella sp. 'clone 1']|uniref:Uncharacterized protein n=1 Tax=Komarekiella delphini-convector SJRDD-AB1 TaxID=2593771 RepID=A0AA40VSW2_9NOST|nr:hypothetical protein [Komarekiella delphini-convector SJRDD-AB1]
MNLMNAILLTLINTAACLALPRLLTIVLAPKPKSAELSPKRLKLHRARVELTNFPYCTVYTLTGSQFCKFSPHFCDKCSPN